MNFEITKENLQLTEMYLNVIISEAERLSSGNVAHGKASIKGHAEKIKSMLTLQPKYKCIKCKDTGVIISEEYRGHTEGIVGVEKPCSCRL